MASPLREFLFASSPQWTISHLLLFLRFTAEFVSTGGDINLVGPFGGSKDRGTPDDDVYVHAAVDRSAAPVPLDITNADADESESFGLFRRSTIATPNPANFDSYVFMSIVARTKADCDRFVSETTAQCKAKLPGNPLCLSEVTRQSTLCYKDVGASRTISLVFTLPYLEIKSPAPLTSTAQCFSAAYSTVPLMWCDKLYGPTGQNIVTVLNLCKKKAMDLRLQCYSWVLNNRPYNYVFQVLNRLAY
ncbi:hypothetical protein HDU96_009632 [Phlyctochytrium bullatum]|nr:hypothetical protein HDU96_009632 [Phlyctochytrium bullatum]